MPAGDELLWSIFCPATPVLRGTVLAESEDERSDLEVPFFGTGGADSSISVRASRDFDPEICGVMIMELGSIVVIDSSFKSYFS